MTKKWLTLILLILAISLTVAGCATSSNDGDAHTTTVAEEPSDSVGNGAATLSHHNDGVEDVAIEVTKLREHEEEKGGHHAVEPLGDHGDDHPAAVVPGAREVTLTASEWEFAPTVIYAKLGEPMTIVLVNDGIIEHDVEVATYGLHLHAEAGLTMKGSFVPDKLGTFEFACEIAGHRAAGMVGKLMVTD